MDIRLRIVSIAVLVLLVIVVLASRFLSRRVRLGLYLALLLTAVGVWGFVTFNRNYLLTNYALTPVVEGLPQPVAALWDPADDGRTFILGKEGAIYILQDGTLQETPFLDLRRQVKADGSENGLLSMALDPAFTDNGLFYVYYYNRDDQTVLARYQVSASNPDQADVDSGVSLLTIDQPRTHHNGGMVAFGPDGYLYLSVGDGGASTPIPESPSQDLSTLFGSILRLDVSDPAQTYTIPPDNPFLDTAAARPEIWAYGLRNPWRFAFAADSGDLYIADVGNMSREEINFHPGGAPGGQNYGWRWYEGTKPVGEPTEPPPEDVVMPLAEYDHLALGGCSIIGGYVYRGQALPKLRGKYIYGDFCSGFIWSLARGENGRTDIDRLYRDETIRLSSFAEDNHGELYLLDVGAGKMFKLVHK